MAETEEQAAATLPSILPREHLSVLGYMRYRHSTPDTPSVCRRKNAEDSLKYRQKGNDLYKIKNHDEKLHEKIWKTYTQSIVLAPNNSEELAYGYGNRSALLFHLKKFKDCIKDCNRALAITQSDLLKIKLSTRKADCLFQLNKSADEECNKAMQLLKNLDSDDEDVKKFKDKLKDVSSACNLMERIEKRHSKKEKKKYLNDLSNFPRSEEVPCASKSVAISYSKQWGRHIVATEDIRPGEILALEKNYYTFICRNGMYLYCSYCTKYTWSSIPCDHCIYDVYCSKSCRSKAWEKYHQWECTIYPFIWDINDNVNFVPFIMRFILIAINDVGGIDNMKELLIELDKCKDPRTKGFVDGVLQSNSIRSIYSLTKHYIVDDPYAEFCLTEEFCIAVELLARHTTFFGQKMNGIVSNLFKNKDVLFVAALMLHTHYIICNNSEHLAVSSESMRYATTTGVFTSLINHSCDPNIQVSIGQKNTTFIFALKPIRKGTQLMSSYIGKNFLYNSKEERQSFLEQVYKIKCTCLPCIENWSSICLPTIKTIGEVSPQLLKTIDEISTKLSKVKKIRNLTDVEYSHKLLREISFYLESMAEKITIYCDDCDLLTIILGKAFHDVFGEFHFSVPDKCYSN